MLAIDQLFRRQQYDEGRTMIARTPPEILCRPEETILHIAVSLCDDGSATRIAVEQGYGNLLGTRATRFRNHTPLHIIITRSNHHAFNQIKDLLANVAFDITASDECVILAVTYNREYMLPELIENLHMSLTGCRFIFQKAVEKGYYSAASLLFAKYADELLPLMPQVLIDILRRKSVRTKMMPLMYSAVALRPALKTIHTTNEFRRINEPAGRTLLHIACAYKAREAIDFVRFLATDASVFDVADRNGHTPLHIAYRNYNFECLKILLAVPGCPIQSLCSPHGQTFFSFVMHRTDTELWDAMITGNPQVKQDACAHLSLLLNDNIKLFEHAIKNKTIDASAHGFHGRNLLMFAVFRNVSNTRLDLIFEHGEFDIDDQDSYGNTALHYAASNKNHYAVDKILKKRHKSSYMKNSGGAIPVDVVVGDDRMALKLLTHDRHVHMHASHQVVQLLKRQFPRFARYTETPPTMLEMLLQIDDTKMKTLRH